MNLFSIEYNITAYRLMWFTHLIVAKHCVFPVAIEYNLCIIVFCCADEPTKPVARNLWIFYIRIILTDSTIRKISCQFCKCLFWGLVLDFFFPLILLKHFELHLIYFHIGCMCIYIFLSYACKIAIEKLLQSLESTDKN